MSDLIRRVPGDALLYGRIFGLAAAIVWIATGSLIVVPLAAFAVTILFGTIVYSWTAQATRGTTFTLTTTPIGLVIADLAITMLWMMATAADPRSVAFALVLIAAVLVQFRLGRLGTAVAGSAFLVAVAGQQLVLLSLGLPFDSQSVFRLVIVVGLVLLVIGVVAAAYRDEQERGARALRRAHLLEQRRPRSIPRPARKGSSDRSRAMRWSSFRRITPR